MIISNLFPPGTKFEITERTSDSTYGPGTTGFVSFVKGKDRDFVNVGFLNTIITRRGKSGKLRLHEAEISTPIFDIDNDKIAVLLPDSKRKYFLRLSKIPLIYKDVFSMSEIDYLGWSTSYAKYLHKLCTNTGGKFQLWPKDSHDILNRILNLPEVYEGDIEAGTVLCGTEERNLFTSKARKIEASAVKNTLNYNLKLRAWEKDVLFYLHEKGIDTKELEDEISGSKRGIHFKIEEIQRNLHAKTTKKSAKQPKNDIEF